MKRIAADWIFPDGHIVLPIPGVFHNRTARPPEDMVEDWRRRMKLARAVIGWTDRRIATAFGLSYAGVRAWYRISYPPPLVLAVVEALIKDPPLLHRVNLEMERMGVRPGKVKKRVLVPGWERDQVPGKVGRKRKVRAGVVDLVGGKENGPG